MALPNVHINPTILTPAGSVLRVVCSMATCFQNTISCHAHLFYHQRQLTKSHSPPSTHGTTLMSSGAATHELGKRENVPLRWLAEQRPWRHRGGKGKPSSCAAWLLMCSCGTTKPGRLRKARVGVTSNLWIHRDDPSSFPLLRQSFAAGNLDPSLGTPQGGTGTGRQRAERWHKERPALQPRWQPRTPH